MFWVKKDKSLNELELQLSTAKRVAANAFMYFMRRQKQGSGRDECRAAKGDWYAATVRVDEIKAKVESYKRKKRK